MTARYRSLPFAILDRERPKAASAGSPAGGRLDELTISHISGFSFRNMIYTSSMIFAPRGPGQRQSSVTLSWGTSGGLNG
jgi:hypothetical protein